MLILSVLSTVQYVLVAGVGGGGWNEEKWRKKKVWGDSISEPVFVIVYGDGESFPRNRCRQPMSPGGSVRQIANRVVVPARQAENRFLAP
jgi:hypothetical protein